MRSPGFVDYCQAVERRPSNYLSESLSACTGYAPASLTANGQISYRDLIHPEDRDAVQRAVQRSLADHTGLSCTIGSFCRGLECAGSWNGAAVTMIKTAV